MAARQRSRAAGRQRISDFPAQTHTRSSYRGRYFDWPLWLAWIAATTGGWALAEIVFLVLFDTFAIVAWLRGDPGIGVFVAVLQAFVLRRRLTQPGWWIVAGGVGGVLGSLASTYVNATVFAAFGVHGVFVATLLLTALGVGILLGTLQWLVLRRQVSRAAWWVPATCLGMVAGTVLGGFVAGVALSVVSDGLGQEPGLTTINIATGFVGATLHAAITGSALIRLLQSPAPIADDALPTLR